MTRFFRSLVLFVYATPCYFVSSTANYDRQNSIEPSPEASPTPNTLKPHYRNRLQMARYRDYGRELRRKLHRSFGVTSQLSRRSINNNIMYHTSPQNPQHYRTAPQNPPPPHFATTELVTAWTWLPPTITTTVLPPSPTWLPTQRISDSLSLILPSLLSSKNPAVNSTITKIKKYFKASKDFNRTKTRTRKEKSPKLLPTPLPQRQKPSVTGNQHRPDSMSRNSGRKTPTPEAHSGQRPIRSRSKEKSNRLNEVNTSTKEQQSFVDKLADEIEADEVERLAADGNNPLKYVVKDGILYKKNKIPVARIDFSPMDTHPSTSRTNRKTHAQTVMDSSAITAEQTALLNSINNVIKPRKKPIVPFSPPTTRFLREERKVPPVVFNGDNDTKVLPVVFSNGNDKHQVAVLPSIVRSTTKLMEDPGGVHSNEIIGKIRDPPPYPFSHCYMNVDGFMCCNRYLESLMRQSYRKLRKAHRFHECSVQKIVNRIQTDCEHVFNTTFETIVGIDDFAIRAHFAGDLMCKIQEGGRFITAYATAMPTRKGVPPDPLHVVTNFEMHLRDKETHHAQPINASLTGIHGVRQFQSSVQRVYVPAIPESKRDREDIIPFYEKSREDIENDSMFTS